jgi:hypothetical protein
LHVAVSVETPFAHVAVHASKIIHYSAQDAVKEFLGKPAALRMHLDICYLAGASENALKIAVLENKKGIRWTSTVRLTTRQPMNSLKRRTMASALIWNFRLTGSIHLN